jgi:hypothetical protein
MLVTPTTISVRATSQALTAGLLLRPASRVTGAITLAGIHSLRSPIVASRYTGTAGFHSTPAPRLRDFFPIKETDAIQRTLPAWKHHGYSEKELHGVVPAHRKPETFSDWVAWKSVRIARYFMDKATGMSESQKVDKKNPTTAIEASQPLTEAQWLIRFVFLESIAGVPGMVGGMLRHLRSLRLMRRDNGWIETLLEESYNERMHLLTFMKICEPGLFMRAMLLGAQGVFFNALFIMYLIVPKSVHRFVGYLEEEAVHTYTRCIHEIEQGQLPKWSKPDFNIPDIAVQYWQMPEGKRSMKDLILYIRADEACHRSVNHTFANLDQKEDPNPFVSSYRGDRTAPRPIEKALGWDRKEVV